MSRRTITLFIPDLEIGGAERVFVTLSSQFLQLGHGVRLILARKTGPLLAELDPRVEVIDLAAGPPRPAWRFGLLTLLRLTRELRRSPPEVMLSTLTGANLVALLARLLSRRRFPLVVREAVTLRGGATGPRKLAMRLLYPQADHIVALTAPMAEQLQQSARLAPQRLSIIPNPVDHERIENLSLHDDHRDEIVALQPYVLATGRLVDQKGHAELIRAFTAVPSPLKCIILGEGPGRSRLEELVARLGLAGRVLLPGVRHNPYPWYRNATGFVLASRWEGYPNALLEAMHFGLPIVATRYDTSVETLQNDYGPDRFRLVACGDISTLAAAISKTAQARSLTPPKPARTQPYTVRAPATRIASLLLSIAQQPPTGQTHE